MKNEKKKNKIKYFTNPRNIWSFIFEDLYKIKGHTFLCYNNLFRASNNEITSQIIKAFTEFHSFFTFFIFIQRADFRSYQDWNFANTDLIKDFCLQYFVFCFAFSFLNFSLNNFHKKFLFIMQTAQSRHHWIVFFLCLIWTIFVQNVWRLLHLCHFKFKKNILVNIQTFVWIKLVFRHYCKFTFFFNNFYNCWLHEFVVWFYLLWHQIIL